MHETDSMDAQPTPASSTADQLAELVAWLERLARVIFDQLEPLPEIQTMVAGLAARESSVIPAASSAVEDKVDELALALADAIQGLDGRISALGSPDAAGASAFQRDGADLATSVESIRSDIAGVAATVADKTVTDASTLRAEVVAAVDTALDASAVTEVSRVVDELAMSVAESMLGIQRQLAAVDTLGSLAGTPDQIEEIRDRLVTLAEAIDRSPGELRELVDAAATSAQVDDAVGTVLRQLEPIAGQITSVRSAVDGLTIQADALATAEQVEQTESRLAASLAALATSLPRAVEHLATIEDVRTSNSDLAAHWRATAEAATADLASELDGVRRSLERLDGVAPDVVAQVGAQLRADLEPWAAGIRAAVIEAAPTGFASEDAVRAATAHVATVADRVTTQVAAVADRVAGLASAMVDESGSIESVREATVDEVARIGEQLTLAVDEVTSRVTGVIEAAAPQDLPTASQVAAMSDRIVAELRDALAAERAALAAAAPVGFATGEQLEQAVAGLTETMQQQMAEVRAVVREVAPVDVATEATLQESVRAVDALATSIDDRFESTATKEQLAALASAVAALRGGAETDRVVHEVHEVLRDALDRVPDRESMTKIRDQVFRTVETLHGRVGRLTTEIEGLAGRFDGVAGADALDRVDGHVSRIRAAITADMASDTGLQSLSSRIDSLSDVVAALKPYGLSTGPSLAAMHDRMDAMESKIDQLTHAIEKMLQPTDW